MRQALYSLFHITRNDVRGKLNIPRKRPLYDRISVLSVSRDDAEKIWPIYLSNPNEYCLRKVGSSNRVFKCG